MVRVKVEEWFSISSYSPLGIPLPCRFFYCDAFKDLSLSSFFHPEWLTCPIEWALWPKPMHAYLEVRPIIVNRACSQVSEDGIAALVWQSCLQALSNITKLGQSNQSPQAKLNSSIFLHECKTSAEVKDPVCMIMRQLCCWFLMAGSYMTLTEWIKHIGWADHTGSNCVSIVDHQEGAVLM